MAYTQSPMNITDKSVSSLLNSFQTAVQEGYVMTAPLQELTNVDGTSDTLYIVTMERKAVTATTEPTAKQVIDNELHNVENSLSQGSAETANTTQEAV